MISNLTSIMSFLYKEIYDKSLLMTLTMIFFLFYIRYKSRSGFSIANRVYMLFVRKKSEGDELIDEIMDIERFNFYYNTRAISKRQIKKFELWVKLFELDFKMISNLKGNFNIELLKIRKINKIKISICLLAPVVLFFLFFQSVIISIDNSWLIKINNSEWFWLNANEAKEFSYFNYVDNPWEITKRACRSKKTTSTLNKHNTNLVCSFLLNIKDNERLSLNKEIKNQKTCFLFISIIVFAVFLFFLAELMDVVNTIDSRAMLYKKIKKVVA